MTFRKTLFWTHLIAGVLSAIVIVMLSVTGVLLTYDRQIKDWADHRYYDVAAVDEIRLTVDELLLAAYAADATPTAVIMQANPEKLPMLQVGRRETAYVHPYTGEILGRGNESVRGFFSTITRWHRWFDIDGEGRAAARAITGAANLILLFLIVTGLYLWLPPVYRWAVVKPRLAFNQKVNNAKARDYNWHHVFGFWSLIPLFFIVASGLTLSYTWSDKVVYFLAGDQLPATGDAAPAPRQGGNREMTFDPQHALSLQDHFEFAAAQSDNWRRIDVLVPGDGAPTINVVIDEGTGGEPLKKRTLVLHRNSGEIVRTESFADRTPGSKVLGYFRWLHTGEALGIAGQTVAGLVSAFAVLMAWTGMALSWRRLVSPLLRRRRKA